MPLLQIKKEMPRCQEDAQAQKSSSLFCLINRAAHVALSTAGATGNKRSYTYTWKKTKGQSVYFPCYANACTQMQTAQAHAQALPPGDFVIFTNV